MNVPINANDRISIIFFILIGLKINSQIKKNKGIVIKSTTIISIIKLCVFYSKFNKIIY